MSLSQTVASGDKTCACPKHADAEACIDLRYHGYSPGPNSSLPREQRDECQCVCHDDDPRWDDDEVDDG